jgi:Lon-like protease
VVLVGVLGLLPTPYWIVAPGNAVDLSRTVAVEGHDPPVDRFYLTDVSVQRANALLLFEVLVPGVQLVRGDALVPRGVSPLTYDRRLVDAMDESQDTAAVVAERAAGLHVGTPPVRIVVTDILPGSRAAGLLHLGDEIVAVDGRRVRALGDIARVVAATGAGASLPLVVRRDEATISVRVPTIRLAKITRLGIALEARPERAVLPVAVRYAVGNVAGSSGGLMFALHIYSVLRGDRRHEGEAIAGTGTIAMDGTVGPIEGTEQKLIAAKRAGAQLFFVPKKNFSEISGEHGMRIVPVSTFRDALAALPS